MPDSTATYSILPDTTAASAILPADSAFICGTLELSRTDRASGQSGTERNGIAIDILISIVILMFLLSFNKFINILPYLFGCMLRWKESVHVEDSMQIRRSRNETALMLILPFCLIAAKYEFLPQLQGYAPLTGVAVTFLVLLGYIMVRTLCNLLGKTIPCKKDVYTTASYASWTFFCIYTVLAMAIAGIMAVAGAPDGTVRTVLLYTLAFVYTVFLIRKCQIFKNSCSLFSTILYLCTLEILPTGILVTSAVLV